MIKDFLDDVMDWLMDYFMPIFLIGAIVFGLIIGTIELVSSLNKPTLEQTVETCIMEQKEEEPECKFAILKYTRKQNQTIVMPVPMIIPHR